MISIITTTHKPGPLLDLTIKSVLVQTFSDFEWVVLDNSPEAYFEKHLECFFQTNPHLEYRRNKIKVIHRLYEQLNIGKFKNDAVRLTSCGDNDYIFLLDHDDFLDPKALELVHEMDVQYPTAQYITGDSIRLYYDIENNYFGLINYEDDVANGHIDERQDLKFVDGEVSINIDDFSLSFDYCKKYTYRYYGMYKRCEGEYGISQKFSDMLGEHKRCFIDPHPRIIKKYMLMNPSFQFYEGNVVSEDHIQCYVLGMFAMGCYIEAPTVFNIIYSNASNSSMSVGGVYDSYCELLKKTENFWSCYVKLFGDSIDIHNRYLNIKK